MRTDRYRFLVRCRIFKEFLNDGIVQSWTQKYETISPFFFRLNYVIYRIFFIHRLIGYN